MATPTNKPKRHSLNSDWRHNATILSNFVHQFLQILTSNFSTAYQLDLTTTVGGTTATSAMIFDPREAQTSWNSTAGSVVTVNQTCLNSSEVLISSGPMKLSHLGWDTVMIILLGSLVSIVTTVGNLMVMISFNIDRQLQTISNYFLFSLAVADVTIGLISCPLMTIYTVQGEWRLGYVACQFWLSVDYLMSNASVLNLLLISFDRYFSVTKPLTYRPRRTTQKALVMIAATYVVSLILWPPWIIAWPYIEGEHKVPENICVVQFILTNAYVTIGTAIAAFYLPVAIMIYLYARVYSETERRRRDLKTLQGFQRRQSVKRPSAPPVQSEEDDALTLSGRRRFHHLRKVSSNISQWKSSARTSCCRSSHRRISNDTGIDANTTGESEEEEMASLGLSTANSTETITTRGESLKRPRGRSAMGSVKNHGGISPGLTAPLLANGNIRHHKPVRKLNTEVIITTSGKKPREKRRESASATVTVIPVKRKVSNNVDGHTKQKGLVESDEISGERVTPDSFPSCTYDSIDPSSPHTTALSPQYFSSGERRNSSCSEGGSGDGNAVVITNVHITPRAQKLTREARQKAGKQVKKQSEKRQESKAAKTLSAILLAFVVTWLPYNVCACVGAIWEGAVPDVVWTFSYYLCYLNSTINPICYALCNENFRRTYVRIIKCKWKNSRTRQRTSHYFGR